MPRSHVLRLMLLVAVLAPLCAYVGAYYRLSRASLRNNADYGMEAILYVPMAEAFPTRSKVDPAIRRNAIRRHYRLALFFAPVNWVDRILFGSPPPESCFMTLSG